MGITVSNARNQRVLNYLQRARLSCCRMIWLLSHPLPPFRKNVVSLSQSSCVSPVQLIDGRGAGGAKSYDDEKAWSSLNRLILAVQNILGVKEKNCRTAEIQHRASNKFAYTLRCGTVVGFLTYKSTVENSRLYIISYFTTLSEKPSSARILPRILQTMFLEVQARRKNVGDCKSKSTIRYDHCRIFCINM